MKQYSIFLIAMTTTPAAPRDVLVGKVQRREYTKSPLTETVLEVRVDALPESSLDVLRRFGNAENERYPKIEDLYAGGIEVKFEATGKLPVVEGASEQIGLMLRNADTTELVQLRCNGLSYHKLPP